MKRLPSTGARERSMGERASAAHCTASYVGMNSRPGTVLFQRRVPESDLACQLFLDGSPSPAALRRNITLVISRYRLCDSVIGRRMWAHLRLAQQLDRETYNWCSQLSKVLGRATLAVSGGHGAWSRARTMKRLRPDHKGRSSPHSVRLRPGAAGDHADRR